MAILHYSSSQITLLNVQSFIFIVETGLTMREMYSTFYFLHSRMPLSINLP